MKTIYLFTLFFLFILQPNENIIKNKKSIKVIYKAILKDKNFKEKESFKKAPLIVQKTFLDSYKKNQQIIENINFTLIANGKSYSLTYREPLNVGDDFYSNNVSSSVSGVFDAKSIYTNFDDNNSILGAFDQGDKIDREVSLDDLEWKLINETKEILGYKCYKAIGNLKSDNLAHAPFYPIMVWYTPIINIKAGPTPFATLPGLILSLESPFAIVHAISIKFGNFVVKKRKSKNKLMKYYEYKKYIDAWREKNRPKPKSYYKE